MGKNTNDNTGGLERTRSSRKTTIWTKEKTGLVIELYRKHECLWNHYTLSYRSKSRRSQAINDVCNALHISKFDFGKKIHNLRNQFNSEMKKLERRMEECGCTPGEIPMTGPNRCRWEHFQSLMFLRNVIEPRPGGYQSQINSTPPAKKSRIPNGHNVEEDVDTNLTDNCPTKAKDTYDNFDESVDIENVMDMTDFQDFDDDLPVGTGDIEKSKSSARSTPATLKNQETNNGLTTVSPRGIKVKEKVPSTQLSSLQSPLNQTQTISHPLEVAADMKNITPCVILDIPMAKTDCTTQLIKESQQQQQTARLRDEWDAFGELIASEFRQYNTDLSRKKLKRRIMHAMLEVGEEDDSVVTGSA